jgi:Leucine-rich repeat (LRR) protein
LAPAHAAPQLPSTAPQHSTTAQKKAAQGDFALQILNLDACPNLARLDVSKNSLTSLEGATLNKKLRWLSAASNQITSIDPLRELDGLEVGLASCLAARMFWQK